MIEKAIEAGARALYRKWDTYPAYAVRQMNDLLAADLAQACIEAAIATGELVPVSAVAAERERCAKVCDSIADGFSVGAGKTIAKALGSTIRALEPAIGSEG